MTHKLCTLVYWTCDTSFFNQGFENQSRETDLYGATEDNRGWNNEQLSEVSKSLEGVTLGK